MMRYLKEILISNYEKGREKRKSIVYTEAPEKNLFQYVAAQKKTTNGNLD